MEKQALELSPETGTTPSSILQNAGPASSHLFKWKEFPVSLPPSLFQGNCVQELFLLEDEEEDEFFKGKEVKYLSHNQLETVKRRGTLTLSSTNTQHQGNCTFKLSPLIQKGRDQAYAEFLDGVAFAVARVLLVLIPKLIGKMREALVQLGRLVFLLFDLVVGLKAMEVRDLEKKVNFERCKYLVAELKVSGKSALAPLAKYIKGQLARAKKEKILLLNNAKPPPIPYKFTTPKGLEVDLGLFDRTLFTHITPALQSVLQKTNKTDSWFLQQRERIVRSLGPDPKKEFEANEMIQEEFMRRLINEIFESSELRSRSVDQALIEQVSVWAVLRGALDRFHNAILPNHMQAQVKKVKNLHPLLSRDRVWLKRQEERIKTDFYEKNKFSPHELALEELRKKRLSQGAYFVQRDLYFLRETAPVLQKELKNQKQACLSYEWKVCYKEEPLFKSSTGSFFHRLTSTFFYRYVTALLSLLFHTLQRIPLDSRWSFKVLYRKRHKSRTEKQHRTLRAELESAWRRVSKERRKFEEVLAKRPYSGSLFNTKRMSRLWNVLKWYSYGLGMSCFWGVGFSVLVILVNLGCLFVTGTCVLWPLIYTTSYHIFCIFFKDLDGYVGEYRYFPVFRIGVEILYNFAKIFVTFVTAVVLCPLFSVVVCFGSALFYILRISYDTLVYNLLIKKYARIPLKNSFLVRKITNSRTLYEINEKQGLLILLTKLELERLTHFYTSTLKSLNEPIEAYETFFESFLSKFSCSLNENLNGFYRDLVRDVVSIKGKLDHSLSERKAALSSLALPRDKIKVRDFESFCKKGVAMITKYYQELISDYDLNRTEFFSQKGLELGDWEGLFLNMICEVFGQEVVFSNYEPLSGNSEGEGREGLRVLSAGWGGWVEGIQLQGFYGDVSSFQLRKQFLLTKSGYEVHPPYLTIDAFSPFLSEQKLLRSQHDLLLNPMPLLHPVFVAVLVLNREEGEDVIDLGDVSVRAVVRVVEETTPPPLLLQEECISLDVSESSLEGEEEEEEEEDIVMQSYLGTSV